MKRAITRGVFVAALVLLVMGLVDLVVGVDVTLMQNPKSEAEQAEWRRLRDARDDVAEIYGTPEPHGDVRVVLTDADRLVTPAEAPERRLLFRDPASGTVLLARAAWLRAAAAALVAAVAAAAVTVIRAA